MISNKYYNKSACVLLKNLFILFIIIIIWNKTLQMSSKCTSRHFFPLFSFLMIFFIIIYCMTNKDI